MFDLTNHQQAQSHCIQSRKSQYCHSKEIICICIEKIFILSIVHIVSALMTYNCELPSPRNLGAGGWSVSGEIRGWTFMIMGYPIIMAILRSGVTKPKIKQFIIGEWRGEESSKIPVPDYRGYLFGAKRQVGYAGHAVIKYLVANFQLQRHRTVVRGECKGPSEWIQQWLTHKYMSHRVFTLPLVFGRHRFLRY